MVDVQNVEQKVNLRSYLETQAKRSLNAISATTSLAWTNYDDMNFFPIHRCAKYLYLYLGTNKRFGNYS